jgi:hypothetical protein
MKSIFIDPARGCFPFPFALSLSKRIREGFDRLSLNGGYSNFIWPDQYHEEARSAFQTLCTL